VAERSGGFGGRALESLGGVRDRGIKRFDPPHPGASAHEWGWGNAKERISFGGEVASFVVIAVLTAIGYAIAGLYGDEKAIFVGLVATLVFGLIVRPVGAYVWSQLTFTRRLLMETYRAGPASPSPADPVQDKPAAATLEAIFDGELRTSLPALRRERLGQRGFTEPLAVTQWERLGSDLAQVSPASHRAYSTAYAAVQYVNQACFNPHTAEPFASGLSPTAVEEAYQAIITLVSESQPGT